MKFEPDITGNTTTPVNPLTESTGMSAAVLAKVTTAVTPALSVIIKLLSAAPAVKLEAESIGNTTTPV